MAYIYGCEKKVTPKKWPCCGLLSVPLLLEPAQDQKLENRK